MTRHLMIRPEKSRSVNREADARRCARDLTAASLAMIRPALLTEEERDGRAEHPREPLARGRPLPLERPPGGARARHARRAARARVRRRALRGDRARAGCPGRRVGAAGRARRRDARRPRASCAWRAARTSVDAAALRRLRRLEQPRRAASRGSTTPRSSSSATASWPPSTRGTTSRAPTCAARCCSS